jgi:hypothetical protein
MGESNRFMLNESSDDMMLMIQLLLRIACCSSTMLFYSIAFISLSLRVRERVSMKERHDGVEGRFFKKREKVIENGAKITSTCIQQAIL